MVDFGYITLASLTILFAISLAFVAVTPQRLQQGQLAQNTDPCWDPVANSRARALGITVLAWTIVFAIALRSAYFFYRKGLVEPDGSKTFNLNSLLAILTKHNWFLSFYAWCCFGLAWGLIMFNESRGTPRRLVAEAAWQLLLSLAWCLTSVAFWHTEQLRLCLDHRSSTPFSFENLKSIWILNVLSAGVPGSEFERGFNFCSHCARIMFWLGLPAVVWGARCLVEELFSKLPAEAFCVCYAQELAARPWPRRVWALCTFLPTAALAFVYLVQLAVICALKQKPRDDAYIQICRRPTLRDLPFLVLLGILYEVLSLGWVLIFFLSCQGVDSWKPSSWKLGLDVLTLCTLLFLTFLQGYCVPMGFYQRAQAGADHKFKRHPQTSIGAEFRASLRSTPVSDHTFSIDH